MRCARTRVAFAAAATARAAYMLNEPSPVALPLSGGEKKAPLPPRFSLVSADRENIFPETVKQAEGDGANAVRLYECKNRKTPFRLIFGFLIAAAFLCDMEEKNSRPLRWRRRTPWRFARAPLIF